MTASFGVVSYQIPQVLLLLARSIAKFTRIVGQEKHTFAAFERRATSSERHDLHCGRVSRRGNDQY